MAGDPLDNTSVSFPIYVYKLIGPYEVYINNRTRYESYEYTTCTTSATFWSHRDKYDTSFTMTLTYSSREIEKNVKKLLKKMANEMCKEGWINHIPFYLQPKLTPMRLRNVRLEGRGWANKK
jgi:hypothetical protein